MGGGGGYYDRDITDGYARGSKGYSDAAEQKMSRRAIDAGLLPKDRVLTCKAASPVVYAFDVTGSMGTLPRIIYDKMPLIAGQIVECGYLSDAEVSLAAIGDILSDQAPIQIGDFSLMRTLDDWLQRIWLEGGGGGQDMESYEYVAYYYARMCELPNAKWPFFLFTGDEGFRETLYSSDLARHFGGKHETTSVEEVVAELKKKFKDNVFLVRRKYSGATDERINADWEKLLGREFVVPLPSDQAIADVTLGVFALRTGARTLDAYLEDLRTARATPQTDERINEVKFALTRLSALGPMPGAAPKATAPSSASRPPADASKPPDPEPPRKKGRIF